MKTSEAALEQIAAFEGCRLEAYKDPLGIPTIGVGHTEGVQMGQKITYDEAMQMFRDDIVKYERYVNKTGLELNQNQFDALVSFAYNCGAGNLKKLIKDRTHKQIADAILLYSKGKDRKSGMMVVLPGLLRRRQWEHDMFMTGVTEEPPAYTKGAWYTTRVELRVRTGPGTGYDYLEHEELNMADIQKDKNGNGALDPDSTVKCMEVKNDGDDVWVRIPSGWVAAFFNGKIYLC